MSLSIYSSHFVSYGFYLDLFFETEVTHYMTDILWRYKKYKYKTMNEVLMYKTRLLTDYMNWFEP